jgi:hypothetical protein
MVSITNPKSTANCKVLEFFTYSNTPNACETCTLGASQGCRVPAIYVRQSVNQFHVSSEQPAVSCNTASNISSPFVRPNQPLLNTWWLFAFSYDNLAQSQVYTCAKSFTGTGSCSSFPYGASRLLWNTSGFNVIRFNSNISSYCLPQVKFRDVRLFVNVPLVQADLEAKYSLMLDDCVTDCAVCSDPETCQSCKEGFYLDSNYCRTCDVKCATCSAVPSCLSCAAGYFDTDPSSSTTCETSCPAAKYGDLADRQCKSCSAHCLSCSSETQCISCHAGYYDNNGECLPCSEKCLSCSGSNQCTVCSPEYVQVNLPDLDCLLSCPEGTFEDLEARTCMETCRMACSLTRQTRGALNAMQPVRLARLRLNV